MRPSTRALALVLVALPLAGIAADDDLIAVAYENLPKLWTRVAGSTTNTAAIMHTYRAGCARFSFVVEKNGEVSSFRVLGAWPESAYGDVAAKLVRFWRFEPTALNKQRLPVYTEHTLVWIEPGYERPLGTNTRAKVDRDGIAAQCMLVSMNRARD